MSATVTTKARKSNVYLVKTPTGNHLVRAMSPASAIRRTVTTYSASIATQEELIDALGKGLKIDQAQAADGEKLI